MKRVDPNTRDATFVSVWDGGTKVISPCKVNVGTKEIFDISKRGNEDVENLKHLDREYVVVNGAAYNAVGTDGLFEDVDDDDYDWDPNEFWYLY